MNYDIKDDFEEITSWFENVSFKKSRLGGVDEADLWRKLKDLQDLYRKNYESMKNKYQVLLDDRDKTIVSLKNEKENR